MKQKVSKISQNLKGHVYTFLLAGSILVGFKSCEADREAKAAYMENVKANEWNKGFTEGYNAAMNGMELDFSENDKKQK